MSIHKIQIYRKCSGSLRFDGHLKFETKTDFYNMVFNAHSENVLFFQNFFL